MHNMACKITFNYLYEISIGQVCDTSSSSNFQCFWVQQTHPKPTCDLFIFQNWQLFEPIAFFPSTLTHRTTFHSTPSPSTMIQVHYVPKIPMKTPAVQSNMYCQLAVSITQNTPNLGSRSVHCHLVVRTAPQGWGPRYPHNPPPMILLTYSLSFLQDSASMFFTCKCPCLVYKDIATTMPPSLHHPTSWRQWCWPHDYHCPLFSTSFIMKMVDTTPSLPPQPPLMCTIDVALLPSLQMVLTMGHVCCLTTADMVYATLLPHVLKWCQCWWDRHIASTPPSGQMTDTVSMFSFIHILPLTTPPVTLQWKGGWCPTTASIISTNFNITAVARAPPLNQHWHGWCCSSASVL